MINIINQLELLGLRAAYLPYSRIHDIAMEYEALRHGQLQTKFLKGAVDYFNSNRAPQIPFIPESVLVVASPSPIARVHINWHGKRISIIVPPTYTDNTIKADAMLQTVFATIDSLGYHATPTKGVSHKLLAVHSGLGMYGRNNICYVEGLGSFLHLRAFYTDIPCDDNFHPISRMEVCETCGLCRKNCPTGAISDSHVINAERCLTKLNEHKGEFPDWLNHDAHHCLIGCMKCQGCCPANKNHLQYVDTVEFDEKETEFILSKGEDEPYPESIIKKFEAISFHNFLKFVQRNFKVLLNI